MADCPSRNLVPPEADGLVIKCLAVFQSQHNHDYVLFLAKDGRLPIYLYSYRSGKWQEATEGFAMFPDAVAAFQDAPSRDYEWFTVHENQLQHCWWDMSWKQDWENQLQRGAIVGEVSGSVAAFQNHAPNNFNYEVFAVRTGHLRHWWREWRTGEWHEGAVLGEVSGSVAAFQNHAPHNFDYEVFAVQGDHLWHWWYDFPTLGWASGDVDI